MPATLASTKSGSRVRAGGRIGCRARDSCRANEPSTTRPIAAARSASDPDPPTSNARGDTETQARCQHAVRNSDRPPHWRLAGPELDVSAESRQRKRDHGDRPEPEYSAPSRAAMLAGRRSGAMRPPARQALVSAQRVDPPALLVERGAGRAAQHQAVPFPAHARRQQLPYRGERARTRPRALTRARVHPRCRAIAELRTPHQLE